jgi:hypothetical protein
MDSPHFDWHVNRKYIGVPSRADVGVGAGIDRLAEYPEYISLKRLQAIT